MCKFSKCLYNKYESCTLTGYVLLTVSAIIIILRGCLKMNDINYMDEMKKRYAGLGLNDFQILQVSNAKLTPKSAGQLKAVSDRCKMDNSFSRLLMATKKDTNWNTFEKLDYNKDGIPYIKCK